MNLSDGAGNGAIWKRRAVVEKVSRKKKAAAAMPMQMRICWRKHSPNQEAAAVAELSPNQEAAAVAELSPNQNPAAVKKNQLT